MSWTVEWGICSSLLAHLIDVLGLLENVSWTQSTVSSVMTILWYLPVCDTKVLVLCRILSHRRTDFAVGVLTLQFVSTCHWTCITDFISANQSTYCTFFCGVYIFENEAWGTGISLSYWLLTTVCMFDGTVQTNKSCRGLEEQSVTFS